MVAATQSVDVLCEEQAKQVSRLRDTTISMLQTGQGSHAIDTLLEVIVSLQKDNLRLTSRINTAVRSRFGRRSERLTAEELGQLVLAFGGTAEEAQKPEPNIPTPPPVHENANETASTGPLKPKRNRRARKKTVIDSTIKRNIIPIAVPAGERNCLHCGIEMTPISHVDHERIEFYPARFEVIVRRCETIACKQCKQDICTAQSISATEAYQAKEARDSEADITTEAAGEAAQESTPSAPSEACGPSKASEDKTKTPANRLAGPSLFAHLIESKCDDALPIYRQRDQFSRLGVTFPLNTLYSYWMAALNTIRPVAETVLSTVLGSCIVGVDDTKLDYLDPKAGSKKSRGHLWCFVSQGALVAFDFTETWRAEDIAPRLFAIDGFIQCDDYKGYGATLKLPGESPKILVPTEQRLGCMMHVRRRFKRAFDSGEKDSIFALGYIKSIYAIEAQAKELGLDDNARLALRQKESAPLLADLYAWIDTHHEKLRPKSYLAEAAYYAQAQKPFIERCFTDGRFEIDNGRVERQIREPAVGRKNYLFSGSPEAAALLAGGYSLVCSCRNLGIPTRAYLIDIITRLEGGFPLRRINELRPDKWAIERGLLPEANYVTHKSLQQPLVN